MKKLTALLSIVSVFCFFTYAPYAQAATIALDNSTAFAASGATSSPSFSYTMGSVTNGELCISIFYDFGSDVLASATAGGSAMTKIAYIARAGAGADDQDIFCISNPASGSVMIVGSSSQTINFAAHAESYSNVASTCVADATGTFTSASSQAWSTTVKTKHVGAWILYFENHNSGGEVYSNVTIRHNTGPLNGGEASGDTNGIVTPVGNYSISVTNTGTNTQVGTYAFEISPDCVVASTFAPWQFFAF